MPDTEFGCLPTIIGTMPHTDPQAACSQVLRYVKDIPAWPQLPKRSYMENMYVQFSQGFPGVVVKEDSIYIDRSQDLNKPLEKLYAAYLENDADQFPISPDYATGLHSFLSLATLSPRTVKGQITGPVTWGLTVTDDSRRSIIYDDVLGDALPRFLRLKAAWQEKALSQICPNTIIFVDEPYMAAFGSVSVPLSKERVISLLEEVFSGITGLKGVHCCGNTDWSVLLETSVDIVSFDTYNYAQSLSLYPSEVKKFLDRKGAIAWGIVPNNEEALAKESVASLKDRLEEAMAPFTRKGIRFRQLLEQGLLTPSCGLASLASEEAVDRALELLAQLSVTIRKRYNFT
ncbi:MAG TPA: methionine synthase [Dehalococcoidia bacterium]|nr:methionine synthase [Dehalococcoidia bacterium]